MDFKSPFCVRRNSKSWFVRFCKTGKGALEESALELERAGLDGGRSGSMAEAVDPHAGGSARANS